jgi:hypothetical protein
MAQTSRVVGLPVTGGANGQSGGASAKAAGSLKNHGR